MRASRAVAFALALAFSRAKLRLASWHSSSERPAPGAGRARDPALAAEPSPPERADAPGHYLALGDPPKTAGAPTPLRTLRPAEATDQAAAHVASTFALPPSAESYPPLSFWARPDTSGAGLLLYPLNEIVDERYNVYLQLTS